MGYLKGQGITNITNNWTVLMKKQTLHNFNENPGATVLFDMKYTDMNIGAYGIGFFIEENKIVTNIHVLAGTTTVKIKNMNTGKVYTIEGVYTFDDINDLVVLQTLEQCTPYPFEDSDNVKIGDTITAIGYPEGKEGKVSGTIHGFRNSNNSLRVQLVNAKRGYSGAPVLNAKGKIIAILNQVSYVEKSVDFEFANAITANTIKELMQKTENQINAPVEPLSEWLKRPRVNAYFLYSEGNMKRNKGNPKGAISAYTKAIKSNPDLAEAYLNRGMVKSSLRKYKEAITDYDVAIELSPDSAFAYCNRATANISLKNYEQAEKDCDTAIEINPDIIIAYSNRAFAKVSLNKYQEALNDANIVLEKRPDSTDAFRLYLMCSATKSALGDHDGAYEDINKVITHNPEFAEGYVLRSYIKNELKDFQGAIADTEKTLRLKPNSEMGFVGRATAYIAYGKSKVEEEDYRTAEEFYNKALDDIKKAIHLNPKSYSTLSCRGKVHYLLGESKVVQGDNAEAKKLFNVALIDYTNSIRQNPRNASPYNERGWVRYNLGNFEVEQERDTKALKFFQEALVDSEEAIRLGKYSYIVYAYYHTRGAVKAALKDYDGAIEDFSEAIRLDPKHVLSYRDRAKAKEALGLEKEAKDDYDMAEKLEED